MISAKQLRHVNDRRIENVEDELRCDADGEHEQCYGNHHEFLSSQKIWKRAAIFCERSAEESLHGSYKNDGGDEKAYHGNGRERRRHRERRFENQKLADKSVQAWQTEGRKHGDTHPTAEQRCSLHQPAEIVDTTRTAPLFEQAHKVKKRRRSDAVIEDLHEYAT